MKGRVSKRAVNRQRWRKRIDGWKESGQSQQAFCKNHHLGLSSFQRWRRIFKAEEPADFTPSTQPVHFLPVRVHTPASLALTIRIQDDLRIEVPDGFNLQMLKQVIQILRVA